MRLFLALNLPQELRERIHEAGSRLRDAGYPLRWTPSEEYHITLKFMGNVAASLKPALRHAAGQVARRTAPLRVELGGFGAFPTIRRPRVLWLGAVPSPALRCLRQDLEWVLSERGFEREARTFHPHVTLGRASEKEGAGAFRGLDELAAGLHFSASFEPEGLDLMRSHLSAKGARYTVIDRYPFVGETAGDGEDDGASSA